MDIFTWLGGMPSRATARVSTRQHDIEVEDKATARLEYPNGESGYLIGTVNEVPVETHASGHAEIVRNLARAILHGKALISPGPEASAILLSGHRGKSVDIPVGRCPCL